MKALLIVDVQNDFMEEGPLPIKGAKLVVSAINTLIPKFDIVLASKDWHPEGHCSFLGCSKGLWPTHCLQNSRGSDFSPLLNAASIKKIFYKGSIQEEDSYSAFYVGEHHQSTGLKEYLAAHHIEAITIAGLILEYCVKSTALDALSLGLKVTICKKAIGVGNSDQQEEIWKELKDKGVKILNI